MNANHLILNNTQLSNQTHETNSTDGGSVDGIGGGGVVGVGGVTAG